MTTTLLAVELRQSSDDLTRMVRTYVATSNPIYKAHYMEIIDIRNGAKPRPTDAYNVYWDLVFDDDARPREFGETKSLSARIRDSGVTEQELALLEQARHASDALTKTEYDAMALVEGPDGAARRERAMQMLHDEAYHRAKAAVMGPIARCIDLLGRRTRAAVKNATDRAAQMRFLLLASGVLLLVSFSLLIHSIYRANWAQVEKEAMFRAVFENAAVGLAQVDRTGRVYNINQAFLEIIGYKRDEVLAADFSFRQILSSDAVADKLFHPGTHACSIGDRCAFSEQSLRKDGNPVWTNFFAEVVASKAGGTGTFIVAAVDVSVEKSAAEELDRYRQHLEQLVAERTADLAESEGRFRFITENTYDVIWVMDLKQERLTYVSPSVYRLRGYTPEEVMAVSPWESLLPESEERIRDLLRELEARWNEGERDDMVRVTEVVQPHKDGHVVQTEIVTSLHPGDDDSPAFVLGVTRDISARKRAEEAVRHLAFYDGLTELPNRRLLLDRLRQSMARASREKTRVALLFVDLDKFKPVNDELGHQMGDWLLQSVTTRMTECLREYDTAARIGGDEFIVLLPDLQQIEDALIVAERLRVSIATPFETEDGIVLKISASIGVGLFPDQADNERDLLRVADEAMYRAKKQGRNQVEILSEEEFPFRIAASPSTPGSVTLRLTWKPTFACGDTVIDMEHRGLFRTANRLISAAIQPGRKPEDFIPGLDALLADVTTHFDHEETILSTHNFPRFEEHARKHRALLLQAGQLCTRAAADEVSVRDVVAFLAVDVIAQHILTDDREYFPFIDAVPAVEEGNVPTPETSAT